MSSTIGFRILNEGSNSQKFLMGLDMIVHSFIDPTFKNLDDAID